MHTWVPPLSSDIYTHIAIILVVVTPSIFYTHQFLEGRSYLNHFYTESESVSCAVIHSSLRPHGLQSSRLLSRWNILEWKAIPFSRRQSQPWDRTWISYIAGSWPKSSFRFFHKTVWKNANIMVKLILAESRLSEMLVESKKRFRQDF